MSILQMHYISSNIPGSEVTINDYPPQSTLPRDCLTNQILQNTENENERIKQSTIHHELSGFDMSSYIKLLTFPKHTNGQTESQTIAINSQEQGETERSQYEYELIEKIDDSNDDEDRQCPDMSSNIVNVNANVDATKVIPTEEHNNVLVPSHRNNIDQESKVGHIQKYRSNKIVTKSATEVAIERINDDSQEYVLVEITDANDDERYKKAVSTLRKTVAIESGTPQMTPEKSADTLPQSLHTNLTSYESISVHKNTTSEQAVGSNQHGKCPTNGKNPYFDFLMNHYYRPKPVSYNQKRSCDECSKTFRSEERLNSHKTQFHTPFKCFVCRKMLLGRAYLKRHLNSHDQNRRQKCYICGQILNSNFNLEQHIFRKHTNVDAIFTCDICAKEFKHIAYLKSHMKAVHIDKLVNRTLICDICSKNFVSRTKIARHMIVHSQSRDFHCEVCGRQFSQKSSLARHLLQLHAG